MIGSDREVTLADANVELTEVQIDSTETNEETSQAPQDPNTITPPCDVEADDIEVASVPKTENVTEITVLNEEVENKVNDQNDQNADNANSEPKEEKGIVSKTDTITKDLENNAFPLKISVKKRNAKAQKLKAEEFTTGIFAKNKTGFSTKRPVRWALALEKYLEDLNYRWQYRTNKKTKKYSEARISLCVGNSELLIVIFFNTGIITIQGDCHADWTCDEFPKIETLFSQQEEPDEGEETDKNNEDVLDDIEILHKKDEEFVNAINTQDDVIQRIIDRCQAMELKLNALDLEPRLLEVEKNLDNKLTVFMETIMDDVGKRIEKSEKKINKVIDNIKQKMGEFKMFIQNQINPLIPRVNKVDNISAKVDNISDKIKHIDVKGIKESIVFETEKNTEEFEKHSKEITDLQKLATELNDKIEASKRTTNIKSISTSDTRNTRDTSNNKTTEILMCFDSNGKFIDRKLLWKVQNSVFKRCGNIHEVSKVIEEEKNITKLDYVLLSIGVNDLDNKDHEQVIGEMKELVNQIRTKYENVKFIIGEATPRKDDRDIEVKRYNELLKELESENEDVTIAIHQNLRDPKWSNHRDIKHIHESKIGKYAGNLITAMKKAYNINSKRELYPSQDQNYVTNPNSNFKPQTEPPRDSYAKIPSLFANPIDQFSFRQPQVNIPTQRFNGNQPYNDSIQNRMQNLANFERTQHPSPNLKDPTARNDLLAKFTNALQKALNSEYY